MTSLSGRKVGFTFRPMQLKDACLRIRLAPLDARVTESRQVERSETPVQDVLGNGAPCRRRVHHSVAGKTGDHVEVVERPAPVADDRVVVQLALLVMARPRAMAAGRFEGGKPLGDRRPDDALEVARVHVELKPRGSSLCTSRRKTPRLRRKRDGLCPLHKAGARSVHGGEVSSKRRIGVTGNGMPTICATPDAHGPAH